MFSFRWTVRVGSFKCCLVNVVELTVLVVSLSICHMLVNSHVLHWWCAFPFGTSPYWLLHCCNQWKPLYNKYSVMFVNSDCSSFLAWITCNSACFFGSAYDRVLKGCSMDGWCSGLLACSTWFGFPGQLWDLCLVVRKLILSTDRETKATNSLSWDCWCTICCCYGTTERICPVWLWSLGDK
jgi:hypothetical protein